MAVSSPRFTYVAAGLTIGVALLLLSTCTWPSTGDTQPVIKVGLAAPFEGLGRSLGYDALSGVKLALAECNSNGGVAGYMVELVALDHGNDPHQARLQAAEMAADPDVVAVIAGWSRPVAAAEIPAYHHYGLPVVIAWTASPELTNVQGGIVSIAADETAVTSVLLAQAPAGQKVLVIGDTEAARAFEGQRPTLHYAQPPASWTQAHVDTWVSDLLVASRPAPPVVLLATTGERGGQILAALVQAGWQGLTLASSDAGSPLLADTAGQAAAGVIVISPAPAGKDLSPAERPAADIASLGPRGVMAYDATRLLLAAIQAAAQETGQQPDRQRVMESLPRAGTTGLTGEITLENGRRQSAPLWLYQMAANEYPGTLLQEIRP